MSATVWHTRVEPSAVRNGQGPLHLAVPGTTAGGNIRAGVATRWLAACTRKLPGRTAHAIDGDHAQWLLEDNEVRWCPECAELMDEADTMLRLWELTGW